MNVARAMGNSLDRAYVPELIKGFSKIEDERTRGMIAWALGRLGGKKARNALEGFLKGSTGLVREEIVMALDQL